MSDILKAYTLYVKEKAVRENLVYPEFWPLSRRVFKLTIKDIRELITTALEKNFTFLNKSFAAKDKDYGRSLYEHFEDINKEWMNEYHIEDFGQLFDCYGFNDFKSNEKYAELRGKYIDELGQIEKGPIGPKVSYILYYWNKSSVGRALVDFFINDSEERLVNDCRIKYYNEKTGAYYSKPKGSVKKEGAEITTKGKNSYVLIRETHLTFLLINYPEAKFTHKDILFCTYNTTTHASEIPFSGVGILKKTNDPEISEKMKDEIPSNIYHHLFSQISFITGEEISFVEEELSITDLDKEFIAEKNSFTGVYQGFYLDEKFEKGHPALRTLLLKLMPSGEVIITDGELREQQGFYYLAGQRRIMFIDADHNDESNRSPRYQMIIDVPQNLDFTYMEGVYGGYNKNNIPFVGLIKLKKLKECNNIDDAKKLYPPLNYTIAEQEIPGKIEESIKKSIIPFLEHNIFYNSPAKCLSGELSTGYKGPTGFFYFYSSSSEGKGLVQYPVFIKTNGVTEIKTQEGIKKGKAQVYANQHFLILDYINYFTKDPLLGMYLIHSKRINGGMASGVSVRINGKLQVQSKREYIISFEKFENKKASLEELEDAFNKSEFKFFFAEDDLYKRIVVLYPDIHTLSDGNANLIFETTKIIRQNEES